MQSNRRESAAVDGGRQENVLAKYTSAERPQTRHAGGNAPARTSDNSKRIRGIGFLRWDAVHSPTFALTVPSYRPCEYDGNIMTETSVSLLERLRHPNAQLDWTRLVALYTPLLRAWAKKAGLQDADVDDLVNDVFAHLMNKLPDFQ